MKKKDGEIGQFNPAQFTGVQVAAARLLAGAEPDRRAPGADRLRRSGAMACDEVQVYQCQAWAKFTGDADYDQPFHCDYVNHTLTGAVRRAAAQLGHLHLPLQRRHRGARADPLRDPARLREDRRTGGDADRRGRRCRRRCSEHERSAAGPAGSLFVYGIDIWHRGTNLTAPGGHRYVMTTCFKDATNTSIAFTAWQFHHTKPWRNIIEHGSPSSSPASACRSRATPIWTPLTLARAQARYPGWDLTPWREAMVASAPSEAAA